MRRVIFVTRNIKAVECVVLCIFEVPHATVHQFLGQLANLLAQTGAFVKYSTLETACTFVVSISAGVCADCL